MTKDQSRPLEGWMGAKVSTDFKTWKFSKSEFNGMPLNPIAENAQSPGKYHSTEMQVILTTTIFATNKSYFLMQNSNNT